MDLLTCIYFLQEWGFRALRALCYQNVLQEELLIKYEIWTDISRTLHKFGDSNDSGVLEEALSVLACLAGDMDILRRQCLLEQTHMRVAEVINTHQDCQSLLSICFETLGNLSGLPPKSCSCLSHLLILASTPGLITLPLSFPCFICFYMLVSLLSDDSIPAL